MLSIYWELSPRILRSVSEIFNYNFKIRLSHTLSKIYPGELMVIVEFCRFGNLQSFLARNRNLFVNQVNIGNDSIDPTMSTREIKHLLQHREHRTFNSEDSPSDGMDQRTTEIGIPSVYRN